MSVPCVVPANRLGGRFRGRLAAPAAKRWIRVHPCRVLEAPPASAPELVREPELLPVVPAMRQPSGSLGLDDPAPSKGGWIPNLPAPSRERGGSSGRTRRGWFVAAAPSCWPRPTFRLGSHRRAGRSQRPGRVAPSRRPRPAFGAPAPPRGAVEIHRVTRFRDGPSVGLRRRRGAVAEPPRGAAGPAAGASCWLPKQPAYSRLPGSRRDPPVRCPSAYWRFLPDGRCGSAPLPRERHRVPLPCWPLRVSAWPPCGGSTVLQHRAWEANLPCPPGAVPSGGPRPSIGLRVACLALTRDPRVALPIFSFEVWVSGSSVQIGRAHV